MSKVIRFQPLYMPRVWGGRHLESLYNRKLPSSTEPYGESWELSDRIEEQSVVIDGLFAGKTLHQLWTENREEIFGDLPASERFPLLIKILDAGDELSIQVHPPTQIARELGGKAKTEMWYIVHAEPGAKLYVGLKEGVTREQFEQAIADGSVESVVHAIEPKAGQSIFIPSGRLHAIGAGLVIYEIQQNSDTTYRVFDWNRMGLNGVPRDLHVEESMQCIDFNDFEPAMDKANGNIIARCEYFQVEQHTLTAGSSLNSETDTRFAIISVVSGDVAVDGVSLEKGDFALLAKGTGDITSMTGANILFTRIP